MKRSLERKTDGGHAFPTQSWEYDGGDRVLQYQEPGMSLRDYFAAKAMAAFIAEPVNEGQSTSAWHWTSQLREHTQMSGPDIFAHAAYMMADAMLKAKEGEQ